MLSMFIAKNAAKTGCKFALSYSMTGLLKNILPKKVVFAFSLVELLMALLVASLLMAALAPVMTRKIGETLNINGSIDPKGTSKKIEIDFNSNSNKPGEIFRCDTIVTETDGSKYCEGEFIVPNGYNGIMKVTVIGAGGGGGTAPTAGYVEYTNAGSTNTFTVPEMVNKLEATLIGGGAGGGAGGQITTYKDWFTGGVNNWDIPVIVRNKNVLVTGCGGGGGGGGSWASNPSGIGGAGGGSGAYRQNAVVALGSQATAQVIIGGGGGFGGGDDSGTGGTGQAYGGGGGGHERGTAQRIAGSAPGGAGGYSNGNTAAGILNALGGTGAGDGSTATGSWAGGAGATGGSGGSGGGLGSWLQSVTIGTSASTAGGAGGGPEGGGGGGGGSTGCGGGGGGATILKQNNATLFNVGGGGGGAGFIYSGADNNFWVGGGGGGGNGGGAGGGGGFNYRYGRGGSGGVNGANYVTGGKITNTVWGSDKNYCAGGNGGVAVCSMNTTCNGTNGNNGAMRISYLTYGTGGSGGGATRIYADYPLDVIAKDALQVIVGKGGEGGKPGSIGSNGVISNPIEPTCGTERSTYIKKGDSAILGHASDCGGGGYPGNSKGIACGPHQTPFWSEGAWINSALGQSWPINGGMSAAVPVGYFSTNGRPAGDSPNLNCNVDTIESSAGGRGATNTTPYTGTCTPGAGGTLSSPEGKNASGYGCGGGGGYGLAKGGNGSGGYARLAWNMYWDAALNSGSGDYQYTQTGSGGGGASGNVMTHTVSVISGQTIRIRIGQGGVGAKVENNSVVAAIRGGDTVFGDSAFGEIRAGGGGGGISPSVSNTGVFTNGKGGNISNVCHYKSKGYLNNANYCIKGKVGNAPLENSSVGGVGANFAFEKISGIGGAGGRQDSGENSNGSAGSGIGAGGGGAAIRKFSNGISAADALNNPNKGGQGANGKIIIEWWE